MHGARTADSSQPQAAAWHHARRCCGSSCDAAPCRLEMVSSPVRGVHALSGASPNRRAKGRATPSPLPSLPAAGAVAPATAASTTYAHMPLLQLFERLRVVGAPERVLQQAMDRAHLIALLHEYTAVPVPGPEPVAAAAEQQQQPSGAAKIPGRAQRRQQEQRQEQRQQPKAMAKPARRSSRQQRSRGRAGSSPSGQQEQAVVASSRVGGLDSITEGLDSRRPKALPPPRVSAQRAG
jgi:hypothetical protein